MAELVPNISQCPAHVTGGLASPVPRHPGADAELREASSSLAAYYMDSPDIPPDEVPGTQVLTLSDVLAEVAPGRWPEGSEPLKGAGYAAGAAYGGLIMRAFVTGDGSEARLSLTINDRATELAGGDPYLGLLHHLQATFATGVGAVAQSVDGQRAAWLARKYDEVLAIDARISDTRLPVDAAELARGSEGPSEIASLLRCGMLAMAKDKSKYGSRERRLEVIRHLIPEQLGRRATSHVVRFRRGSRRCIDDSAIRGINERYDKCGDVHYALDMGEQHFPNPGIEHPSPYSIGCLMRLVRIRQADKCRALDTFLHSVVNLAYENPDTVGADLFDFDVALSASAIRAKTPTQKRIF